MFDLVSLVQTAGYLGLFAIIFAESGLLVGFFLPGDSLLFTAGFLASQGFLNIFYLVVLLFIAAFIGDAVGYSIGRRLGPSVFSRPKSVFFNPENIDKTSAFFAKHGIKTVILARFLPVIRTFVPVLAGVGGMKYRTFATYNAVGALAWAVGVTSLGYIFGNSVPNADKYIIPIVLGIIVVTTLPAGWQWYRAHRDRKVSS